MTDILESLMHRPIPWEDAKDALRKLFDHDRIGLITDMDGTISPIVPVPSEAAPTERNRQLLQALHDKLALVAVVSGRAAADVRQRVNLPNLVYAGNHGLERWTGSEVEVAPAVAPYVPHLQAAIRALEPTLPPGMWIEDKGATLSIHYRNAADPQKTAEEMHPVINRVAVAQNLRVFQGRMIFELRPPLDMHKGTVFKQLIGEYDLQAALYVGDDTTDADALRMARTLRQSGACYSLGIGVISDDTPSVVAESSDISTSGVSDVEALFAWLSMAASAS